MGVSQQRRVSLTNPRSSAHSLPTNAYRVPFCFLKQKLRVNRQAVSAMSHHDSALLSPMPAMTVRPVCKRWIYKGTGGTAPMRAVPFYRAALKR